MGFLECKYLVVSVKWHFLVPVFKRDQDISSSGQKFELPKKSNFCPHHQNQPSFYTVLNIYPEYMYDVPLSPEPCL